MNELNLWGYNLYSNLSIGDTALYGLEYGKGSLNNFPIAISKLAYVQAQALKIWDRVRLMHDLLIGE